MLRRSWFWVMHRTDHTKNVIAHRLDMNPLLKINARNHNARCYKAKINEAVTHYICLRITRFFGGLLAFEAVISIRFDNLSHYLRYAHYPSVYNLLR